MAPVPAAAFRDLLADLPRTAFADFVADLWAARGRDIDRDGQLMHAGDRTLVPVHDPADAPEDSAAAPESTQDRDRVVVSATPAKDPAVVDPAELREILLYDVPRDRAAALFEDHFDQALDGEWPGSERGRTPAASGPATSSGPGPDGTPAPRSGRTPGDADSEQHAEGSSRPWDVVRSPGPVLAVLLVVLLVGIAVGAPGGPPVDGWLGEQAAPTGSDTSTVPSDGTPPDISSTPSAATATDRPTTGTPLNATGHPPGLSSRGVVDAGVLGEAHARGVMGRSYKLVVIYREYRDGAPSGVVRETIQVSDGTVYVSDVVRTGVLLGEPQGVSTAETYADGSIRYERRNATGEPVYTVRDAQALQGGESPFAGRVERFVRERLGPPETRVVGTFERNGATQYLVMFRGESWVGSARIDEAGVVHALRWRFTPEDHPRVTAEVVVRYDFGPVSVAPPDWIDEARNATQG